MEELKQFVEEHGLQAGGSQTWEELSESGAAASTRLKRNRLYEKILKALEEKADLARAGEALGGRGGDASPPDRSTEGTTRTKTGTSAREGTHDPRALKFEPPSAAAAAAAAAALEVPAAPAAAARAAEAPARTAAAMAAAGGGPTTLVITHDNVKNSHPVNITQPKSERPKRIDWIMGALRKLKMRDPSLPFTIETKETSDAMTDALANQLAGFADPSAQPPTLRTSHSVEYLERSIVPSVQGVHTEAYLKRLATTCLQAPEEDGADAPFLEAGEAKDTPITRSSLSAALSAALSSCLAVDQVCDPATSFVNAFAVIRPPGHHAGAEGETAGPGAQGFDHASHAAAQSAVPAAFAFARPKCGDGECSNGFCLLNNAAIAARHALKEYKNAVQKVAIIDIDLHHGNGTEEIVRGWKDVMYVSLHGEGDGFYPETARTLQVEDRVVNVPFPEGTGPDAYLSGFDDVVPEAVRRFRPDLIIISCGFDAAIGDSPANPGGFLKLTAETYGQVTKRIVGLAQELCQGRLVSLLEGGYDYKNLQESAREHVTALMSVAGPTAVDDIAAAMGAVGIS
jgi:acetoin utilization deacetylase AcuC-like enzyme